MRERAEEVHEEQQEDEELEFILLDLHEVAKYYSIPPNAPFVLSGLDTINPILVIDNKVKLIGEYQETIGTCLVFGKTGSTPTSHAEESSSGCKSSSGVRRADSKQPAEQQAAPVARANRILAFKLLLEHDSR